MRRVENSLKTTLKNGVGRPKSSVPLLVRKTITLEEAQVEWLESEAAAACASSGKQSSLSEQLRTAIDYYKDKIEKRRRG